MLYCLFFMSKQHTINGTGSGSETSESIFHKSGVKIIWSLVSRKLPWWSKLNGILLILVYLRFHQQTTRFIVLIQLTKMDILRRKKSEYFHLLTANKCKRNGLFNLRIWRKLTTTSNNCEKFFICEKNKTKTISYITKIFKIMSQFSHI